MLFFSTFYVDKHGAAGYAAAFLLDFPGIYPYRMECGIILAVFRRGR